MIQKIEHLFSRSLRVYFTRYAKLQLKVDFNDIFVHHTGTLYRLGVSTYSPRRKQLLCGVLYR